MYKSSIKDHRKNIITPSGEPAIGYAAKEIENIKIALNRKLGPEFISKRKGPGFSSIQYLEGWKAINLANDIFGFNGWCTELKEFKVDYIDDKHGSISLGLSCIVRVILKDGTYHEDIGYGSIENCKSKSMAFDKCKKEAVTDGMKRALRQFGNALGNCLYDKDFLQQITKVSTKPVEFDEKLLMRRSTTMPNPDGDKVKLERGVEVDKRGNIGKEEENEPIQLAKVNKLQTQKGLDSKLEHNENVGALIEDKPEIQRASSRISKDDLEDSFMFSDDWPNDELELPNEELLGENNFTKTATGDDNEGLPDLPDSDFEGGGGVHESGDENDMNFRDEIREESTGLDETNDGSIKSNTSTTGGGIPDNVTFVSATSADTIQRDPTLQKTLKYDVSVTSTQMNKSSFINHSKSLPVKKSQLKVSKPVNPPVLVNNSNPLVKRSFGMPASYRLSNKRLRK